MLTRDPIVQIHPSRFCNYTCLHCYSSSSPDVRDGLPVNTILSTTARLADEGYRLASLSGGEPVLYADFATLAKGLTTQGYRTSVISNGTHPHHLLRAMQAGHVQHAAISIDGPQHLHDTIRQKQGAFKRALIGLSTLLDDGQSTGALVSVTQQSLPHLPQVVGDLITHGVQQIQLHPIAAVGRAGQTTDIIGAELPQEALMRLILMTEVLSQLYPNVQIDCDAVSGAMLNAQTSAQNGQLISPIIIRDDGWLVPYSYDVSKTFALGHISEPAINCRLNDRTAAAVDRALDVCKSLAACTFYREFVDIAQRT